MAPSKIFAAFTMDHRELAELAQAARVRNLVPLHVTAQFDRPGMRERVIREVCEIFEGNVHFGEDLMERSPLRRRRQSLAFAATTMSSERSMLAKQRPPKLGWQAVANEMLGSVSRR